MQTQGKAFTDRLGAAPIIAKFSQARAAKGTLVVVIVKRRFVVGADFHKLLRKPSAKFLSYCFRAHQAFTRASHQTGVAAIESGAGACTPSSHVKMRATTCTT